MILRISSTALAVSLAAGRLLADFSYQQESKMTGGAMAGMMKLAGAFSKQAREPMRATVAVKGNRMLHQTGNSAQIIDLDKQTITSVDFEKKTYSEMTFAEFTQALEKMSQKMNQAKDADKVDMSFHAAVKETGETRTIQGMNAKQVILSMEMQGTDKQSGQQGGMMVISNMWIAPQSAGYQEIANFHQRMGQKLAWTPGVSGMAMGRSDIAKGFASLYKEAAKLEGMPVLQIITMRPKLDPETEKQLMEAMAKQDPNAPKPAEPQGPTAGQAATNAAGNAAGNAAASAAAGRMGRLGGIAGGLGGFGGFGRKKKQQEEQQQAPAPQAEQQQQQAGTQASASLIEMTTETSGFSTAALDSSKFDVPAGFKKIESDMQKALR
jgi:hypothetical protein